MLDPLEFEDVSMGYDIEFWTLKADLSPLFGQVAMSLLASRVNSGAIMPQYRCLGQSEMRNNWCNVVSYLSELRLMFDYSSLSWSDSRVFFCLIQKGSSAEALNCQSFTLIRDFRNHFLLIGLHNGAEGKAAGNSIHIDVSNGYLHV
jgi:hypothetical protein